MLKCNKSSTFSIFSERKIGADGAKYGWKLIHLNIFFCKRKSGFRDD